MSDANHTTAIGRLLSPHIPDGPLKSLVMGGDYVADALMDKVADKNSPVTVADAAQAPETNSLRQTIISGIIAGGSPLLYGHDVKDLTPEENALLDEIAIKSTQLVLMFGLRKAGIK